MYLFGTCVCHGSKYNREMYLDFVLFFFWVVPPSMRNEKAMVANCLADFQSAN